MKLTPGTRCGCGELATLMVRSSVPSCQRCAGMDRNASLLILAGTPMVYERPRLSDAERSLRRRKRYLARKKAGAIFNPKRTRERAQRRNK